MIVKFLDEEISYEGSQLNGLFDYQKLKVNDDSLIAFIGAADVKEGLIDEEDRLNQDFIKAKLMLHFIMTIRGNKLRESRLWQLHLIQIAYNILISLCFMPIYFKKFGDDIFVIKENIKRKLSVSIATLAGNEKEVVHFGINILDEGAPIPTYSLQKLNIDPKEFGMKILNEFKNFYEEDVQKSLYKVRGV